MADATGLYTVVQNTSGKTRSYGFLGPHGILLAAGQQYSEPGNLFQKVAKKRRLQQSLAAALLPGGGLAVVSTPSVILLDATKNTAKRQTLNNGTVALSDPTWGPLETILTGAFNAISSPQAGGIASATIVFSAAVTGFDWTQIVLTQNGTPVALSVANNPTSGDNITWTVPALATLTNTAGAAYVLKVPKAGSKVIDAYNNPPSADISVNWSHS